MVDFHTHSTASDGYFSPSALIRLAYKSGIKVIALTDHDTVDGLEEAEAEAKKKGIIFIRGIELEASFESTGVLHILGLKLRKVTGLESLIAEIQRERINRNKKIICKMREHNMKVRLSDIDNIADGQITGRPHFARWMVEQGIAKSIAECFNIWLGRGKPLYSERLCPSASDVFDLIHSAGGQAVIAHPHSLNLSWQRLWKQFSVWKDMGLNGIEAYHSGATKNDAKKLENMAKKLELIITGGSDFHGPQRPERRLSFGPEGIPLDYGLFNKLEKL